MSSFEVESTIAEHPAVAEVTAFAVSAGESAEDDIMITVILAEGAAVTAPELCSYCNDRLRTSPCPATSTSSTTSPRTPTNRVQKYQLRERGVTATTWDRVDAGFIVTR